VSYRHKVLTIILILLILCTVLVGLIYGVADVDAASLSVSSVRNASSILDIFDDKDASHIIKPDTFKTQLAYREDDEVFPEMEVDVNEIYNRYLLYLIIGILLLLLLLVVLKKLVYRRI